MNEMQNNQNKRGNNLQLIRDLGAAN